MSEPRKKLYHSISEVSKILEVKPHVLRYWESQFRTLRPKKNRAGNRMYREKDLLLLERIKDLLYTKKYTIAGAKKALLAPALDLATIEADSPKQTPTSGLHPAVETAQLPASNDTPGSAERQGPVLGSTDESPGKAAETQSRKDNETFPAGRSRETGKNGQVGHAEQTQIAALAQPALETKTTSAPSAETVPTTTTPPKNTKEAEMLVTVRAEIETLKAWLQNGS